jgi:hypothetical protein
MWIVQRYIIISHLCSRFLLLYFLLLFLDKCFLLLYLLLLRLAKCFLDLNHLFCQSELLLHRQELNVPLKEAFASTRGRPRGRFPQRSCLPCVNHTIEDGIPSKKTKIKSKVSYITFTKIKIAKSHRPWDFLPPLEYTALGSIGVFCQSKPSPWILTTSSPYFACNYKHTIYVTTNISENSI